MVYKTEKGKYNAVIEDIIEHNKKGQPVLVGTISIEKSELLSRKLYEHGIKHNVLNAKHHEQEAEIVAQAGHKGAVTIATKWPAVVLILCLAVTVNLKTKQQLRFKGYREEVINEAVGYAQTEDTQVLKARGRIPQTGRTLYRAKVKRKQKKYVRQGSVYYWYRASRIPSY